MIPVGDEASERGTRPWVTWAILGICLAALAWTSAQPAALKQWALVPARLLADPSTWGLTLVTHAFLHADLLHFANNALFLWVFAHNVEDEMGHLGFGLFFLAAAVLAGLASVASRPGSDIPGVGVSGAISAVLAAYLVLHPFASIRLLILPVIPFSLWLSGELPIFGVPAWALAVVWLALQVAGGLEASIADSQVDYAAHLGGFAVGYLTVRVLRGAFGLWPDDPEATGQRQAATGASSPPDLYLELTRPLAAGAVLEREHLTVARRQGRYLDPDAVPAERLVDVLGRRLVEKQFRYEALRWSALEPVSGAP